MESLKRFDITKQYLHGAEEVLLTGRYITKNIPYNEQTIERYYLEVKPVKSTNFGATAEKFDWVFTDELYEINKLTSYGLR